ncbi:hypothetical protein BDZ91DRAFT_460648 [Kalaharituber pfeilii]|nr:hypothetical protein BDZ91DRAFT_460648 [Kalaharituber pfeilii]
MHWSPVRILIFSASIIIMVAEGMPGERMRFKASLTPNILTKLKLAKQVKYRAGSVNSGCDFTGVPGQ